MSFKEKIYSGFRWAGILRAWGLLYGFVSTAILARLLAPEVFGLFAMAGIVFSFSEWVTELGTSDSIIRRQELNRTFESTTFWLNVGLGICFLILIFSTSWLVARFFHETSLTQVINILGVCFLINAAAITPQALLTRAMRFQDLAKIDMGANLISLAVSVAAALGDQGVLSLVYGQIAYSSIKLVFMWQILHWKPQWSFSSTHLKEIWKYSASLSLSKLFNHILQKAPVVIIGKILGDVALAYYDRSERILLKPLKMLNGTVIPVMFPTLSRFQDDPEKMRNTYYRMSEAFAILYFPLAVICLVIPLPLVDLLLGAQWHAVALLLPPLGLMIRYYAQISVNGLYLKAMGRTDILMRTMLSSTIITIAGLGVGTQWGIEGVVWAFSLCSFIFFFISMASVHWLFTFDLKKLFLSELKMISYACVMGLVVWGFEWIINYYALGWPLFAALLGASLTGSLVFVGLLGFFKNEIFIQMMALVKRK